MQLQMQMQMQMQMVWIDTREQRHITHTSAQKLSVGLRTCEHQASANVLKHVVPLLQPDATEDHR